MSVTSIGPTVFAAPVNAIVMLPVTVAVRPDANCTETRNAADPLPDVGDTTSHGAVDAAVQVTDPAAGLREPDRLCRSCRCECAPGTDGAECE